MNEEEKEKTLKWLNSCSIDCKTYGLAVNYFSNVLNIISNLENELDKKDKRIKQLETDNKVLEQSLWEEGKGKYKD